LRVHDLDHGLDELAWCEVLARSAFDVFCVLLKKAFIDLTLHIQVHPDLGLIIDHHH
jgi:hypothetical protein